MSSIVCNKFDPEEENANERALIEKGAHQDTKSSLLKRYLQRELIAFADSGGQLSPTRTSPEMNVLSQPSKQSKKAGKDANRTKGTKPLENSKISRFDDNTLKWFHLDLKFWRSSKTLYEKIGFSIAGCPLLYVTQLRKESTLHCLHF